MLRSTWLLAALFLATGCEDDQKARLLAKTEAGPPDASAVTILPPTPASASATASAPAPKKKADCNVPASGPVTNIDKVLEKEINRKLQRDGGAAPITRADLLTVHSLNLTIYGKIATLDP
jgi:hypothetical protein